MAEFALTIPIFLLLVFGVIELSRFFLVYSSVFTASREATRFASSVGDIEKNYLDCEAIAQRAVFSGQFGGVQLNDITISYESTPGTVVASCPDVNSGTVPINVGCTGENCEYEPELGHRVLVDIVTEFDSLLGIVPNLPIRANNGRTIMKEIAVEATPKPEPICEDDVDFLSSVLVQDTNNKKKLYVDVINLSTYSNYRLEKIIDITWDNSDDKVYLEYIYWGGVEIWSEEASTDEPPIDITSFISESTQNLPAEFIKRLEFVFSKNIAENFEITFSMYFYNAADSNNYCHFEIPIINEE